MESRNYIRYIPLIIGIVVVFGWGFVSNAIWPPKPPQRKPSLEEQPAFVAGTLATAALAVDAPKLAAFERKRDLPGLAGGALVAAAVAVDAPARVASERRQQAERAAAVTNLIPLGHGDRPFHLQLLLNSQGGAIQQVVITDFQHADREGLPVTLPDGRPKPLHLIPGVRIPRTTEIRAQREVPVHRLLPGKYLGDPEVLEHPSYVMYHYERGADSQPVDTLGRRDWKVVSAQPDAESDTQTVAFETELGAPHFVKITKTYTLNRTDYHVGLTIDITPTARPEGQKVEPFRYQIDGPRGMPIEGEWYTSTYRQGVVGWVNGSNSATRDIADPREVRNTEGSDRHTGTDAKPIRYAGVMVQYFASVLALDNHQPNGQAADFLEYVRFTPEGPTHKDKTFLDDLTFRAISKAIPTAQPVTHAYVLYQGPVKVRLLKQLTGDQAVPEETVNRYRDDLHLRTLTDAPSPTFIGRFANFIFWTDIVVAFTNLIHSILGLLSTFNPWLGLSIVIITVMVRAILYPLSRRQSINAKIMQEKQAKLAPDVKKLTELHGDDWQKLQQEKSKLFKEHGIHPAAALGGCLPVFAQMPIFMGLYFALQESVFFRLESFLWLKNLAAPDMLAWWSEKIPFISTPGDLGSALYLGPYLNLLPLISVAVMMYAQSKIMPVSDDPQVQMQRKTMKFMMVMMAFFFYKVAAGLCIYFICTNAMGIFERMLLPKKLPTTPGPTPAGGGPSPGGGSSPGGPSKEKPKPAAPKGWMGKKVAGWKDKWEQVLEDAQKQQGARRDPVPPSRVERGKKKKKR